LITRGSKFFYGAAVVAYLSALVYGFLTAASASGGVIAALSDGGLVEAIIGPVSFGWKGSVGEHVGYSVLMGAAAVLAAVGGFHTAFRDGDAEAVAAVQHTTSAPAVLVPAGLSYWPLICAFGVGLAVVGLALDPLLFVVGLVLMGVGAFSWTVRAWAERISADPAVNREFRHQLVDPLEIPVVSVLVAAVVVLSVSRVLLAIPKLGATFLIIILAVAVFAVAVTLANRPRLSRSAVLTVLLVGGLALIGAGIAGGLAGPREFETHGSGDSEHSMAATDSSAPSPWVLTDVAGGAAGR
jgi:hypothetical protein